MIEDLEREIKQYKTSRQSKKNAVSNKEISAAIMTAINILLELLAPIIISLGIGYWLDKKLDHVLLYKCIMLLPGFIASILNVRRYLNKIR